jgi:hypothetical protein
VTNLTPIKAGEIIEAVIARGDIAALTPEERAKYYSTVCQSVGLNPMTRPFEYITLNGRLTLYARKDATDQLRAIHEVSVTDLIESERDGVFIVTAKVVNGKGRMDAAKGAVSLQGLKGEALANALMKAETKAKRRATLSVCGLGFLDETEIEDIPQPTTLPKKNAKDIYVRLQKEIDEASNRAAFKAWMNDNAESIKTLPEDWQDILRLRAQDKIVQLQNEERGVAETVNAETGEIFADQVIWEEDGERPATAADVPEGLVPDPLDIPEPLKRLTPKQEALWLDLLRSVAAAAPDTQTMMDLQVKHMSPAQQRKVSPTAWLKAVTIFRGRVQWLTANPVFDAETWLAGDLAGALSGAETPEQLAKVKDKLLIPERDRLTQDQWRVAVKMYRERLDAIDPQNGLAGG